MTSRLRALRPLIAFVIVYYLGFIALGLATGQPQVWFYAGFVGVLIVVVALWGSRVQFSRLVLWGLAIWGLIHMAGGLVELSSDRVLYNVQLLPFLRFDQLVHVFGFGIAGLAFYEWQRPRLAPEQSGASLALFGGLAFGALNEMIEFLITRVVPETNIGGFENTGWDLVANFTGSVLAALWVRARKN